MPLLLSDVSLPCQECFYSNFVWHHPKARHVKQRQPKSRKHAPLATKPHADHTYPNTPHHPDETMAIYGRNLAYLAGVPVLTSPYLGVRSEFDGSDLVVNLPSVNEDLRFTNKAGHLTDSDGRLVDDEGRFVAYRTPEAEAEQDVEQRYFVDRSGEEVVKVTNKDGEEEWIKLSLKERKPFLDDEGNPIISEAVPEKSEDIRAEKPKRTRAKKTEKDVEST